MPLVTPTNARRRKPVLRQGSSQSSVGSVLETVDEVAPEETSVASAARQPPMLRKGSSSASIIGARPPEVETSAEASDTRPPGVEVGAEAGGDGSGGGEADGDFLLTEFAEDGSLATRGFAQTMQRRWRAARRSEYEQARRTAAEYEQERLTAAAEESSEDAEEDKYHGRRRGGGRRAIQDDDDDDASCVAAIAGVCACCVFLSFALLWVMASMGGMLYGLMWFGNMTTAEMIDDFHRTRASNLEFAARSS